MSGRHAVSASASPRIAIADGLGHAGVGVGTEQAFDACLNRKSVAFDFLDRVAEFGGKMRPQREDAQFDFGVRGKLAKRPVEMAVIGARGGNDADAALVAFLAHDTVNLRANLIHEKYRWGHDGLVVHHQNADAGSAVGRIHLEIDRYDNSCSTGRDQGSEPSLLQGKRLMHRFGAFALLFSTGHCQCPWRAGRL